MGDSNLGSPHKDHHTISNQKILRLRSSGLSIYQFTQDLYLAPIFEQVKWAMSWKTCLLEIQDIVRFERPLLYHLVKLLSTIFSLFCLIQIL